MKNKQLSQWLQDHTGMLGTLEGKRDSAFYVAMYEGIIDMALSGDTRMVDSVLESAAAHAVAVGRELTHLLGVPQLLRQRVWDRLGEEIDPEPAFMMLSALDEIFVHIFRVTIDAYLETTKLAMAAKSTEISRLYTESEQKVMEYATEVTRANRELARLEQAKTDFIGIAAHELKTPLTLIQGYVNILLDQKIEPDAKSFITGISQGALRMNAIIENMLDLSNMDMKKLGLVLQKIKLKSTIDLVIVQAQTALEERRQTIETANLNDLPAVEADASRIHQIFRELISNAIKYTPDGGHITITGQELAATSSTPARIKVTVKDTGVGIAPEDRDKVFEKFYRAGNSALHSTGHTKFMGAGPGLGLAIVKGLIEAHGGQILVESPGFDLQNLPGSTFAVVLLLHAQPQPGIDVQWMIPERGDQLEDVSQQPESIIDPSLAKQADGNILND